MENFEYLEPRTLKEAIGLLVKHKKTGKLLAGGTDLIIEMKEGLIKPQWLINLKKIKGLDKINFSRKDGLTIGTLVTWTNILSSNVIREDYPILREAASVIGCSQIRNIGTIGGNICHASPSADSAPALMIYEVQCLIAGPSRERIIPIDDIFTGVQKISLKEGEILTSFRLPPPDKASKGCYIKFALRNAMGLPVVGVGVLVRTSNGTFKDVKIALGAVASTPLRARKTESFLLGKPVDDEAIRKAAELAMEESEPINDIRASREYRLGLVRELTYRAIKRSI